jgi:hypothetical protein
MRVALLLPLVSLTAAGLLSACGSSEQACFDDRTCGTGMRCVDSTAGKAGVCAPCDAAEIPYDGVDNDCNARTRDLDLDGDGQNAKTSPFNPGMDCDDDDATTYAGADEVCSDGQDNDCDDQVDERDCADFSPPSLAFLSPADGQTISGSALLEVQVNDDVGAVELVVRANNVEVGRVPLEPTPTRTVQVNLATVSLPDGSITLRAEATDLKGRSGTALITVNVDNVTPPEITVLRPVAGGAYGGFFSVAADVTDPSGVSKVEIDVDGVLFDTITTPPFTTLVDTSSMADGAHAVVVRGFDGHGNVASRQVPLTVDNTPPAITFVTPAPGAVVAGQLAVSVTATDASALTSLTSGGFNTATPPLDYMVDTTLTPNGPLAISATAVDGVVIDDGAVVGNVGSATITVSIDNIDPTPIVTFVTPRANDGVLGPTPLTVTVTSLVGNPIAAVHFAVAGRPAGSVMASPYTVTHNFFANTGVVPVVATAVDTLGNMGSATVNVQVVNRPAFRTTPNVPVPGTLGRAGFEVGDVDGDGVIDVVVGGSELSVLTGTISPATGRWSPVAPARRVAVDALLDIRLGDVNRDGVLDVIGLGANRLRIYLNQGNGTFDAGTTYSLPQTGMTAFEVGDLDGDQDPDVVVVGGNTSGVAGYTLLLDNGLYALGQNLGGDVGATDVALGNLDGDNDLDVVVGRSGSLLLTVFRNGGTGNFGAGLDTTTPTAPETVAVGDVTGDGAPDIVVAQPGSDSVRVLQVSSVNPFSLALGPAEPVLKGPVALAIGQVAGNATADLVVGSFGGHGMQVLLSAAGSATGLVLDETYVVTQSVSHLRLVDFDQDGALDVVAAGSQEGVIAYARNLGSGKYLASITYTSPFLTGNNGLPVQLQPRAVAAGNVLGTPGPEVVVTFDGGAQNPPELVIYEFNVGPQPNLYGLALPNSITPPNGLAVGVPHPVSGYDHIAISAPVALAAANPVPTAIIYELAPPNVFPHPLLIDHPSAVAVGDVDSDGFGEAIFSVDPTGIGSDGAVVINLDATPPVYGPLLGGDGANAVTVGNFDFDLGGMQDFAVANSVTDNITVQVWTGAGGYLPTTYNAPTNLRQLTSGFVNADGYQDIVGLTTADIFVMEGDPQFGFRTPTTFPAGQAPFRVLGGDFNQDGLFDVMTLNSNSRCSVMLARPQGGFFPPLTLPVGAGPLDFTTTDVDLDGRDDVVVVQGTVPTITILHNNADGL